MSPFVVRVERAHIAHPLWSARPVIGPSKPLDRQRTHVYIHPVSPSNRTRPISLEIKGTAEQIADRVRMEIEEGELAPGTPLNQADLAARFGMSRIPVREALRHLAAEGYVTYRPNKGANVVSAAAPEEVEEIIEIRECLEARLMDRAVDRLTPEALDEASEALDALNRARTSQQLQGAHQHFHTLLFHAAQRPRMAAIINGWRFRLDVRPDVDGARKRAFARATRDVHRRLLDACRNRDHKAAARCVAAEYEIIRATSGKIS
jgi:DNA-binding GntR family transcriptional regulator